MFDEWSELRGDRISKVALKAAAEELFRYAGNVTDVVRK